MLIPSLWVKLLLVKTLLTESPEAAAEVIKKGGLAAFPTETVYGLGANVFDKKAVANIFTAKNRPADNPLIAHVGDIAQIAQLAAEMPPAAHKFADAFFPGPLTLVLKKSIRVPKIATAGLDSIGVRMPRNETARRFLQFCGVPVVAPSANLSGNPSPTTWQAVNEDLNGRIDCILMGPPAEIGLESTVVDCTADAPVVLRLGAVSLEKLREIVPETGIYFPKSGETPKSPGLRHKHYSPKARVKIYSKESAGDVPPSSAFIGLHLPAHSFKWIKICRDAEEYAHFLFAFFRECDRRNAEIIFCEEIDEGGIGAALMDRIRRAAEK